MSFDHPRLELLDLMDGVDQPGRPDGSQLMDGFNRPRPRAESQLLALMDGRLELGEHRTLTRTPFDGRCKLSSKIKNGFERGWSCMEFQYKRLRNDLWVYESEKTYAWMRTFVHPAFYFPGWMNAPRSLSDSDPDLLFEDLMFGHWITEIPLEQMAPDSRLLLEFPRFIFTLRVQTEIPRSGVLRVITEATMHNRVTGKGADYYLVQTSLSDIIRQGEQANQSPSNVSFPLPLLPDRLLYHWLECIHQQFNSDRVQLYLRRKASQFAPMLLPHFPKVLIPIVISFILGQQLFRIRNI